MAESKDRKKASDIPVSTDDFVAYVRGKATQEQSVRVIIALFDKTSELNAWLRAVNDWIETAMPTRKHGGVLVQNRGPALALDDLLQFVANKRASGMLTDDDVAQVEDAGGLRDSSQLPRTPAQIIAAVSRMKATIVELHPELKKELRNLRSHHRE